MEASSHDPEAEKFIGHGEDTELTPCEGMEFESEDAARDFYSLYARHAGFRIRISRYTRSRRDNSIISRRIVCSKEGFHETRNCGSLHPDQKQQERTGTRVGCKAMIMIKKIDPDKWVVTKFVKKHNHGSVPPRKLDIRSAHQDLNPIEKPHPTEVEPVKEPVEGMEFDSEEAAKSFYINYARLNGFRARISRYCRSRRDNSIISRQIVCSKEGFREVRTKKEITDEGKTKRPRMITRVGCKAMIVVKKMNSGKWMVSKFEKEHNHSLVSKLAPSTSNITSGEVAEFVAKSSDQNEVKAEGYNAEVQCYSTDSLTVLYNNLCQEAIKFAKEGSVTEDIYHVAMSALKEAAEKVAQVKSCHPIMPQHGVSGSESKHKVLHVKTMDASQCSDEVRTKITSSQLKLFQEPTSNLVIIPTNSLTDSGTNSDSNALPSCAFPRNGGQGRDGPEQSYLHAENRKEDSSEKYQNCTSNRATQRNHASLHGPPEETAVAISAIPLTLYMPVTRNPPGASADGQYKLLGAPIEAVPISYRPAEPIRQSKRSFGNSGPLPGAMSELTRRGKGPNPLVHATALACGARVVPLEEAASLIKAIESKIRSGEAKIARLPPSGLTHLVHEAVSMSSSSEDGEEHEHNEPLIVNDEGYCHDYQISEEMKLHDEPSELETDSDNCSA
uniref:Uncharacterized protein n=1 Tax=Avena sativa TaxID=4498 RepID=A0ACD5X1D4_AVESA